VFCMGCGAELRRGMDHCAVCGRPIDGPALQLRQGASLSPVSLTPPPNAHASRSIAPGIVRGDLDAPGFPRDAAGRALLIVVLGMLIDLLVPWLDQEGVRWSPGQAGLFTVLIIAVLAAALTPLAGASLRHNPLAAAVPLAIGAAAFGATTLLWFTVRSGATASTHSIVPGDVFGTRTTPATLVSQAAAVDLGLYLFLIGSCVLAYCGYRLFLAAARAHASVQPQNVLLPATPARSLGRALPPVTADNATGMFGQRNLSAAHPMLPASPATQATARPSAPAPDVDAANTRARATTDPPSRRIATPGTAEWNTAPSPPERLLGQPPGGWRRQPGVHR
jgi:hypothetical protein